MMEGWKNKIDGIRRQPDRQERVRGREGRKEGVGDRHGDRDEKL